MVSTVVGKPLTRALTTRLNTRYTTPPEAVTALPTRLARTASAKHSWKPKRVAEYGVLPTPIFSKTNTATKGWAVGERLTVVYRAVAAACKTAVSTRTPVVV